jgi:hypothetical protein
MQKKAFTPVSHQLWKINSKWIKYLNVNLYPLNYQKKIEKTLQDIGRVGGFQRHISLGVSVLP